MNSPRMLKDFLAGDLNSSSSNGFRSIPRKPCQTTVRNLIDLDLISATDSNFKLQRSRSSRAASTTISAIHRASEIVVDAVKRLHISRRFSNRRFLAEAKPETTTVTVTVKVKDILRWRSFRDLIEEKPPPSDLSSSPTESTGTATSSNSSSWCESDFSVDSVGDYRVEATTGVTVDPKVKDKQSSKEKEEQRQAVSNLDFSFAEHEESLSSSSRTIVHMQRRQCILMHKTQEHERCGKLEKEFQEEEDGSKRLHGKYDRPFDWELEHHRYNYITDMDQQGVRWCNFDDQEQLASDMEISIFIHLVDELLFDLFIE